jgi:hypothetical protein
MVDFDINIFFTLCNVYRQNQRNTNNCKVLQQILCDMIRIARGMGSVQLHT